MKFIRSYVRNLHLHIYKFEEYFPGYNEDKESICKDGMD